jgi:hypothetical protein
LPSDDSEADADRSFLNQKDRLAAVSDRWSMCTIC